jgi:hypothetical protein
MKASPPGSPSLGVKENSFRLFTIARAVAVACFAMSSLAACGSGGASDSADPEAIAAGKAAFGRSDGNLTPVEAIQLMAGQIPNDPAAGGDAPRVSGDAAANVTAANGTAADGTAPAGASPLGRAAAVEAKPAAPTAPPTINTINTIDTIVDDMRLPNDRALAGIPSSYSWSRAAQVIMGAEPRGTGTPSWWNPYDQRFKSGAYWKAILPWFVIFDGTGNSARNTRVQVRDMKLWMKRKSDGQWVMLDHAKSVSGELYPKSLQGANVTKPDSRDDADGTSILPPGGGMVYHGWSNGFSTMDGADLGALFITLQARLVQDDPARGDDRAQSEYLLHVGGDYYPDTSTRVTDLAPAYYFPGIGVSRAKLVTNEWRAFSFATLDVAAGNPGGGAMSEDAFRRAPPPLD